MELELNEKVLQCLEVEAMERGISTQELIRWIISEHTRFTTAIPVFRPALRPAPLPGPSDFMPDEESPINKVFRLFVKSTVDQGALKCHNCTMPLKWEDLENGKCGSCGTEI